MTDHKILEKLPRPSENRLLFGHEIQRQFLLQQLHTGRLHHALLFAGKEGIGKAGFAYHLAYHLLAEDETSGKMTAGQWRNPDAHSALWRKMEQGAHPGLLTVNRIYDLKTQKIRTAIGVEDIRRISHFLRQTAADKGWRIVIIDSADDMNRNAANALLKTLEEPPVKTLFILISHNIGRLLPTIRSRCQTVHFKPLPDDTLRMALKALATPFGYDDARSTDDIFITLAEGSINRALSLWENGGTIYAETLSALLKEPIFPVPQAQKLSEDITKRSNSDDYTLFLDYVAKLIYKQACLAIEAGNLSLANTFAVFYAEQSEAIYEAAAYNLDKKQFILVSLQKLHHFLQIHKNS